MADFAGFRSLKANFTTTPNQYFDRVVGHYHPCVERVVAILVRSTLGWEDPDTGERRLEAELALKDFIRPELSESSARTGIAGAIEAGFIIQTMPATNKQPARYALRWVDATAQKEAITRQRKAHGITRRHGAPVMDPKWKSRGVTVRPLSVRGVTVTPPKESESEIKSSSEKKRSFKKGLASPSGKVVEDADVLATLPKEQWATLEAEARARVIAEYVDPVRKLAREGKAWTTVRPMMRKILAEKGFSA